MRGVRVYPLEVQMSLPVELTAAERQQHLRLALAAAVACKADRPTAARIQQRATAVATVLKNRGSW